MTPVLRLFIIDDDNDDVFFFREAISELNIACRVTTFTNGKLLIDYLSDEGLRPHMIVLDLNMPLMDGLTVLKRIKANEELKKIPVFVLSTSHSQSDSEACRKLGCVGFYTKPVELRGYMRVIEDMFSRLVL
jgi:CheY-like chemotaxis protein